MSITFSQQIMGSILLFVGKNFCFFAQKAEASTSNIMTELMRSILLVYPTKTCQLCNQAGG